MSEISEFDLIREAIALNVFAVFGDDPYTIPVAILTQSWMKTVPSEERNRIHLWNYASKLYLDLNNGHGLNDHTYRRIMDRLEKRRVVDSVQIRAGRRPQFDYVLTEYGETVCEKLKTAVLEQIRLEKWRRRSRK